MNYTNNSQLNLILRNEDELNNKFPLLVAFIIDTRYWIRLIVIGISQQ